MFAFVVAGGKAGMFSFKANWLPGFPTDFEGRSPRQVDAHKVCRVESGAGAKQAQNQRKTRTKPILGTWAPGEKNQIAFRLRRIWKAVRKERGRHWGL